jgi:hypothetical protein
VQIDSRSVGTTKQLIRVAAPGSLARFVSGTNPTGNVRVRVRCTTNAGAFYARADQLRLDLTRP